MFYYIATFMIGFIIGFFCFSLMAIGHLNERDAQIRELERDNKFLRSALSK